MENKYQASEEFDAGMRKALFHMNPPNNLPFKWEACSKVFMDGYTFGRSLRDQRLEAKNLSLRENGFDEIEVITTA